MIVRYAQCCGVFTGNYAAQVVDLKFLQGKKIRKIVNVVDTNNSDKDSVSIGEYLV